MENQIKILRASLGGAYIPTRILDAAGLVELMRELINPDPHEMYRVPYKLDPYQDLNYQCVDDSFDMQVTAGHLKIGRLGRDGKECVTRVTSYHLESDPEMAFLWTSADNYANLLNPELSISCPFVITLTLMVEDRVKTQNEANMKFMDVEKKSKTSYAKFFSERDKGNAGVGRYPPATGDQPDLPRCPTSLISPRTPQTAQRPLSPLNSRCSTVTVKAVSS